ncbi:MAG: PPC domain-containing DNA-binding protein, partial [Bryobacteraceae bacterium]
LLAGSVPQKTRREVVRATTPEEDARPNSDRVPDVYAIPARLERVVILRFKYQTDLLEGLERMVRQQAIRNAVILAGAGSVRGYHVHAVSNRTFPSKNVYVRDPTAPADLVSMNGYVVQGRVHAHVTLADGDKAFGGHLEPGTEVFTFAVVTLGVLDERADLSGVDDKTRR